jgi:hypothetical protein
MPCVKTPLKYMQVIYNEPFTGKSLFKLQSGWVRLGQTELQRFTNNRSHADKKNKSVESVKSMVKFSHSTLIFKP